MPRKLELWEIITTGYEGIHAECQTCRLTTERPWRLMGRVDLQWTLADLAGRLRCSRCGERPKHVKAVRNHGNGTVTPAPKFLEP